MATIQKPERSILASEPLLDGFDGRLDRAPVPGGGGVPPTRAMTAAVLVVIVSAAALVWATLGDSGAQLLESEAASPSAPRLPVEPAAPAHSGAEPAALVVDVGGVDGEPTSTAPDESAGPTTAPTAGADPTSSSTSTTGSSGSTATPPGAALRNETSTPPAAAATSSAAATSVTTRPTTASSGATSTSTTPTTSATSTGSGVVWEEDFNSLDTGRWQIEHSTYGDGNGERQCYRPDNVRVANGRLVLTARSETATCPNGSTRTVTSGMVRSRGLTFSPGQAIEFRVKLTPPNPSNQAGLWPAVWASGWAGSWPRGGELDFLEVMTAEDARRAVFSLHYADSSGGHELQNKAVPLAGYFSDGWHTIRFDYGRNGNLAWYLDGTRVFAVSSAATAQGYPAPFDQTIDEIKLNLAVGGTPGPLASGALGTNGATFEIDYIKVFAL